MTAREAWLSLLLVACALTQRFLLPRFMARVYFAWVPHRRRRSSE